MENAFGPLLFGLGSRGSAVLLGAYLAFCLIYDLRLQLLLFPIAAGKAPLGSEFFFQDVSPEQGFFSSDMRVTPDGDVVVLGYCIDGRTDTLLPRLFIARSPGPSRGLYPVRGRELEERRMSLGH